MLVKVKKNTQKYTEDGVGGSSNKIKRDEHESNLDAEEDGYVIDPTPKRWKNYKIR